MPDSKKIDASIAAENAGPFSATGRRKEATARVWITPGTGKILINGRDVKEYFRREILIMILQQPLSAVNMLDKVDIKARVKGGGLSGQAGAIRHAIARALLVQDQNLRPILKRAGFLTRDPRMKERKKYGQPGRRKKYQYSKR